MINLRSKVRSGGSSSVLSVSFCSVYFCSAYRQVYSWEASSGAGVEITVISGSGVSLPALQSRSTVR